MFYEASGEVFRQVLKAEDGAWLISYEEPNAPRFVRDTELKSLKKVEAPADYLRYQEKEPTEGQKKRRELIAPLLENPLYIWDKAARRKKAAEIADAHRSTVRRIQKLFYRYLAGRPLVEERKPTEKPETQEQKDFSWAIEEYYYSARKMSLKTVYDLLLLSRYTDADGHLREEHPTWHAFRHYFYDKHCQQSVRAEISRDGLSNYQRNSRPLFGSAMEWRKQIGAYQMDETQADIYLVSRLDRKSVVGRPNIYLAVDTATQLIAGIHVGLEAGEQAVVSCLVNAAADKVAFCRRYGIEITKDQWPSEGLPGEIITDKGKEFVGSRMGELAMKFGMEFQSLPPFRPDGKGLVEKTFDLLQQKYKPLLRGKGVIEEDAMERWATDYRSQAVLDLEEFTKVVIYCVLYLNSCRILQNVQGKAEAEPVPAELWAWHESQGESCLIPVDEWEIYLTGLPRRKGSLTRKGIHHQGLWYVSRDYQRIWEQRKSGEAVTVAYDPENVSRIFLLDGLDYLPFELADSYKRYAGTTQEEACKEQEKHKIRKRELEKRDTEGRINMIRNIQAVIGGNECQKKGKLNQAVIEQNREREAGQ